MKANRIGEWSVFISDDACVSESPQPSRSLYSGEWSRAPSLDLPFGFRERAFESNLLVIVRSQARWRTDRDLSAFPVAVSPRRDHADRGKRQSGYSAMAPTAFANHGEKYLSQPVELHRRNSPCGHEKHCFR